MALDSEFFIFDHMDLNDISLFNMNRAGWRDADDRRQLIEQSNQIKFPSQAHTTIPPFESGHAN